MIILKMLANLKLVGAWMVYGASYSFKAFYINRSM